LFLTQEISQSIFIMQIAILALSYFIQLIALCLQFSSKLFFNVHLLLPLLFYYLICPWIKTIISLMIIIVYQWTFLFLILIHQYLIFWYLRVLLLEYAIHWFLLFIYIAIVLLLLLISIFLNHSLEMLLLIQLWLIYV